MALKTSTGLRNGVLSGGSLKSRLDGGRINIYAGTPPATADDAVGAATLLCAVTLNSTGAGINFDTAAAGGVLQKDPGEVWAGANVTGGVAAWYRHVAAGDDGALSTTAPRVQGLVNVAGADLNLSSVSLVTGATQTVDYYSLAWPTL